MAEAHKSDDELVADLREDAEEIEELADPMKLGHDPKAAEAVRQIGEDGGPQP
jgi:hypothetical protein